MDRNRILNWIYLVVLITVPIVLLSLPADYFDKGVSICPSKRFFDIECYGCGMTRAVMHLIHFDFDSAVYYNSLSLIVFPALAVVYSTWLWKLYLNLKPVDKAIN